MLQGGYPKFISQGFNGNWLPSWMQAAGYKTYYVGKLMNGHNLNNYNQPFPEGFDGSEFLLDPSKYLPTMINIAQALELTAI
jgi:arylsulfatase A-like enzyme